MTTDKQSYLYLTQMQRERIWQYNANIDRMVAEGCDISVLSAPSSIRAIWDEGSSYEEAEERFER